ncbi:MAG: hypothetical protein EOO33_10280 [Comamonadaceae bacterium]|nr:MAG: hypothetical protein EOO33_10280 [Comamonadaceae bacterium]
MILVKTPSGQEALKDRHGGLTSRQRSAFILFDGKRTLAQVLAATAPMGITPDDVQSMMDQGLLAAAAGAAPPAGVAGGVTGVDAAQGSDRAPTQRYQAAYPIATELTAGLGLRGFRLNLAVEGAAGYADLAALAPKIREAVGDAKYARLNQALFA